MLEVVLSNQFKKDLRSAKKRGCRIEKLTAVIDLLAEQKSLPEKHRDHGLTGEYRGFRECHIESDWLLVYRVESNALALFLFRTGTHSDLF